MIPRSAVQGVVLAGGDSTRFGEADKALADFGGRPLVTNVVDAVTAATDGPVVLAVADRERGERLRDELVDGFVDVGSVAAGADTEADVEIVVDAAGHAGPLAGLLAAVECVDRPWLFVCACDMPLLTAAGIDAMRAVVPDDRGADAVVPRVGGYPQPMHALYRTASVERVRDDLSRTASLRSLLDGLDDVVEPGAEDLHESIDAAVTNVNTRAELEDVRNDAAGR